MSEYDSNDVFDRLYIYGNYIDEAVMLYDTSNTPYYVYYVHDHLYSPAALVHYTSGAVLERYEYDAYGKVTIMDASFSPRSTSSYGNPYLFTGRRVDFLDGGNLTLQYNRNRYYDYYTARWLTHDPLGIVPNARQPNRFELIGQYADGMNLYEYAGSNPAGMSDPWGLQVPVSIGIGWRPPIPPGSEELTLDCEGCPPGWLDPLPSAGRLDDWHWWDALRHYITKGGADVEFNHESIFARRCSIPDPPTRGVNLTHRNLVDKLIRKAKGMAESLEPCKCVTLSDEGIPRTGYAYTDGLDWEGTLSFGRQDEWSSLKYRAKCCVKKICSNGNYKARLVCRIRWDIRDLYSWPSDFPIMRLIGDEYWQIVHFDKNADEVFDLPD